MNPEIQFLLDIGVNIDFKALHTTDPRKLREHFLIKLKEVLQSLEENGKNYLTANEVAITSFIATALKSGVVFSVSTETNSRGHVDMTVTAPCFSNGTQFKIKAEAKIWGGPAYQKGAFQQLEGYITGAPQSGLLLYYFQNTNSCDDKFTAFIDQLVLTDGGKVIKKENRLALTEHLHTGQFNYLLDHAAAWIR